MPTFDRVKFIKVCGMLTSSHDGEVVAAARRANNMLKQAGLTWEQALAPAPGNGTSPPPYSPWRRRRYSMTPEQKWDLWSVIHPHHAEWILNNREHNRFAASLYEGVMKFGSLTERQMEAVERNL